MKKVTRLFWALALCSVAVVGCSKDNEGDNNDGGNDTSWNPITATVTGTVDSDVDEVRAYLYEEGFGMGIFDISKFEDKKFTLNLGEDLNDKYLTLLSSDVPQGVVVSDASAKVSDELNIQAWCSTKESSEGSFKYANPAGTALVDFLYVDRDVNVTGSYEVEGEEEDVTRVINMNCSLKKGWNAVAAVLKNMTETTETFDYTTNIPSGLIWMYQAKPYEGGYSTSKKNFTTKKELNFFQPKFLKK